MQIERQEIRVFQALSQSGGFSRAAETLGVSQSAVSQAIANLEHKLGTQLVLRGTPIQLTEAGARLLSYAEWLTREESAVIDEIESIRSGAASTLSLGLSSAVNRRYGMSLLRQFSQHNPLTRLGVDVAASRALVYGVAEGRWELGFGPFQHEMPGYFALLPCFVEQRHLVVSRSHPERDLLASDPEAFLRTVPLITSYLDEPARRPGGRRLRDMFASIWEVGHMDLRLAMVAEGKGVTYLSDFLLPEEANLVPISGLPFAQIQRRVGVYYRKHEPLSRAGARFLALVQRTEFAGDVEHPTS